jgi:hypothetical protein
MSHTPVREARVRSSRARVPARSARSRVRPLLLATLLGLAACGDSGSDAGNTAGTHAAQADLDCFADGSGWSAGTGRGTVERQGRGAVIQATGTAQDGTPISATFRCASVETI